MFNLAKGIIMQFKLITALFVFLGSYFPLAIILAVQDIKLYFWTSKLCIDLKFCHIPIFENPWFSLSFLLVTGICLFLTFIVFRTIRCTYSITVKEIKSIPTELINYSFPYIVSFMGVDYNSTEKIVGLGIFLIWLFLLTYKSQQIIMNPILLIFGWNLYEANIHMNGHPLSTKILSRVKLTPKQYTCAIIQSIYVIKGDDKND